MANINQPNKAFPPHRQIIGASLRLSPVRQRRVNMLDLSDKQVADLCASHEEKAARIVKVREEFTREMDYVDSFKRQIEKYRAKMGFISEEELTPALWNLET